MHTVELFVHILYLTWSWNYDTLSYMKHEEKLTRHITFTVEPSFFSRLQTAARAKGLKVGSLIRMVLVEWMERNAK